MKVKISFTVDMQDVPHEVNVRLYNTHIVLDRLKKECLRVNTDNVSETMDSINELRKQLLDVDTSLGDCYSILAGYNNALNGSGDMDDQPIEPQ